MHFIRFRGIAAIVLLLFILVTSFFNASVGQPAIEWTNTYIGFGSWSITFSLIDTGDGYLMVDSGSQLGHEGFGIIKTDLNGNVELNKTCGENFNGLGFSAVKTSDGYAIVGYGSQGFGPSRVTLVKVDPNGNLQWNNTFGPEFYYYGWGIASIVQDSDGYTIACSILPLSDSDSDFYLFKTDLSGEPQWEYSYGGSSNETSNSLTKTSDGYAIAGFITDNYNHSKHDFWLVKTDSDGGLMWSKRYGGIGDEMAYSAIQTSDGGYAIAGSTDETGNSNFLLIKTSSNGNTEWSRTYGGPNNEAAFSVIQTSDSGYAIAGSTLETGGYSDLWLIKTDSAGNMQWNKTVGGTNDEYGFSLVQSSDSSYAIAGWTRPPATITEYEIWLVKTVPPSPLAAGTTPTNLAVTTGQQSTFSVSSSGGIPPYSYQWYEGTSVLTGETSTQLTVTKSAAGTYTYYCQVTDAEENTVDSNTATLTVNLPPSASVTPGSVSVTTGKQATFTVAASDGFPPYTYQWYEGTNSISGETSPQLTVTKSAAGTYSYFCRVTDSGANTADSNTVTLTVNPPSTNGGNGGTTTPPPTTPTPTPSPPPTPSPSPTPIVDPIEINEGASTTDWPTVTLTLEATEPDIVEMRFSNDNVEWSTWQPYTTSTSWTLTEGDGAKTVYVQFRNQDGEISTYTDMITLITASGEPFPLWIIVLIIVIVVVVVIVLLYLRRRKPKLKVPKPAKIRVTVDPNELLADGRSKASVIIELLDSDGNPVSAVNDTEIRLNSTMGEIEKPVTKIPKGKEKAQSLLVSSKQPGTVTLSADAKGLKGTSITVAFSEKKRYCMHCGFRMTVTEKRCSKCSKIPPSAGADTKTCRNCDSVLPTTAKYCSECGSSQS